MEVTELIFELLTLKLRLFLTGYAVAMITCYLAKMITTYRQCNQLIKSGSNGNLNQPP